MEFTKSTIADLSLPAGKSDAIFFDDDLPGFGIRLRSTGTRVWVVQYRVNGRQKRESLGDTRKIDLNTARGAAKKKFAEVVLGGDPAAKKAAARASAAVLMGPLADRYLALKEPVVRKNTYISDKRYLTKYWKPLRSQPIASIARRAVAARLTEITAAHGMTSAARARQSLSAFFSWAMREGLVDGNPVVGTNDPLCHARARDRVLTSDELRAIWSCCGDDDFGRILKLLMLTGARRDEIGGLKWSELDLERGLLNIPGSRTKNHHPLNLTLPAAAVCVLSSAPRKEGRDYLFGSRGGAFCAWSYVTLTLGARIASTHGALTPWRIHDIRRTVATGMAEIGVAPHIVEAILNHRSGHKAGVAGIYNRASYDVEIKRALAVWADHLLAIVSGEQAKIVPLRQTG